MTPKKTSALNSFIIELRVFSNGGEEARFSTAQSERGAHGGCRRKMHSVVAQTLSESLVLAVLTARTLRVFEPVEFIV